MNAKFLQSWPGVATDATAVASLTSMDRRNYPGLCISMEAARRLASGSTDRFIFLNKANLTGGPHTPPRTIDMEPASAGASREALLGWRVHLAPGH